jgi:hypothetical protein
MEDFGAFLMLPDSLWVEIANERDLLCANCICKRLGDGCLFVIKENKPLYYANKMKLTTKEYSLGFNNLRS